MSFLSAAIDLAKSAAAGPGALVEEIGDTLGLPEPVADLAGLAAAIAAGDTLGIVSGSADFLDLPLEESLDTAASPQAQALLAYLRA